MAANPNALQWDGGAGHYEVYYLSATDRQSGCGLWIRYTMVAPEGGGGEPTCSLWFMAMDPERREVLGRKRSWPASALTSIPQPFELRVDDALLTDTGMAGGFDDVSWDLRWTSHLPPAEPVHPLLRRARLAKTVLVVPHPDLELEGTVSFPGRELRLAGSRGGQSHLWGSKHAARWAWTHCNDFESLQGKPQPGTFFEGVSVIVPRLGRELGPNTPIVGRFGGEDFSSTGPLQVTRADSRFGPTGWQVEARGGDRRVVADVDADREQLVGVTYHDPDGDKAYCYNSETATMRVRVWRRDRTVGEGWRLEEELVSPGRAHFEYAQREPVPDLQLQVT
jgi:hypothetical protein